MGRACSIHEDKCIQKFWPENFKGRDHSEDLDVDGSIILQFILEK